MMEKITSMESLDLAKRIFHVMDKSCLQRRVEAYVVKLVAVRGESCQIISAYDRSGKPAVAS